MSEIPPMTDRQAKYVSAYARNAGFTLMGLMTRADELTRNRVDLSEEIALLRATLISAVEHWNTALEMSKMAQTPEAIAAASNYKIRCEQLVREGAEAVGRIVNMAAKTKLLDQGAMQVSSVTWVVAEVSRAIDETVRDRDPELADALVTRIGKIKLDSDSTLKQFTSRAADEAFL